MVIAGGRFEKSPTAEKTPESAPSAVSAGGGSGEVPTAQYNIYQPPASLQGWPDDHDTEAALRHLGLLDFARLQLPDGIPRHDLVSDLVASYHRENCRGYAYVWGVRVSVDRKSFLSAAALQATAEHKVLPPRRRTRSTRSSSTVTCAALQFMEMWILPQFQGRDMLPSNVSAAMREVKAELAHSVDWVELIWDLVKNEILELPKRDDKNSYFGLHLLRLIWVKHPEVFGLKDRMETIARVHLERILPQVVSKVTERIRSEYKRPKKITRSFRVQQPQVVNNLSKPVLSGDEATAVVQVQQQSMVGDESAAAVQVQQQSMVGDEAAAAVQIQQQSMVGDEAAAVDQVQHQSMVVQTLDIVLNNYASVSKRDSLEAALVEPGQADAHKHGVKQQFQQGNREKWTRKRSKRRVPSGSTISSANSSCDIIGIKSEVKHARLENQPTKELLEAEMFIQAIEVLNETLSAETIVHTLQDSPPSGSLLMQGGAVVEVTK
ncbi:uncharacterized protein LOC123410054 isoform X2 [Hordeum vulgare subsp. vulgare]|uniref:uncharacterized protein LOC123410054 isoform X2 n=1 Tax=Hordeum vulgare subsp. vulgare TaxID=112509 RepID=UPI001D1A58A8|nr:uncharacterized protein LOC123410054 isoform X2 [Hordeum vulgare subsp. vulgare]